MGRREMGRRELKKEKPEKEILKELSELIIKIICNLSKTIQRFYLANQT